MTELHGDVETRSVADLKRTGMYKYFAHPTTDVHCLAYAFDDEPVELWKRGEPCPGRITDHIKSGGLFFAHNAGFERQAFARVLGPKYGFPVPRLEQMRCTAAMCRSSSIPGDLERAAIALGLSSQKDKVGQRIMLQMAKPRSMDGVNPIWWETPEKFEALYAYCKNDVVVEREIHRRVRLLSDEDLRVWYLDQRINERGFAVDVPSIRACIKLRDLEVDRLSVELRRLTGGFVEKPTEIGNITNWLKANGLPEVDSIAKDELERLLDRDDLSPVVRRVLTVRQEAGMSSLAKFDAFIDRTQKDHRVRDNLIFRGASNTGRWSGVGVQPQNFPRVSDDFDLDFVLDVVKKGDPAALELTTKVPPMHALTQCLRGMIVAGPDKILDNADLSNIEGRVLAWLAGEEWKLQAFRDFDAGVGHDIYKLTAGSILRKRPEDVTKTERQGYGKVPELALGYQGGVGAFQTMAKTYRVNVSDTQADVIKNKWREAHPRTVEFWHSLERAVFTAVKDQRKALVGRVAYAYKGKILWCRLPSGRFIAYLDPQLREVDTPWGEKKTAVTAMTIDKDTRQWVRRALYGGLLAENATQAASCDIMVEGMLRAEDAGHEVVLTVHDEILSEVPVHAQQSIPLLAVLLGQVPVWAPGLPIAASGGRDHRYRK